MDSSSIFRRRIVYKGGRGCIYAERMGTPPHEATELGMATGPRGEVLLIMAQTAVLSQAVSPQYLAIATAVVLITAVASPILINLLRKNRVKQAQAANC